MTSLQRVAGVLIGSFLIEAAIIQQAMPRAKASNINLVISGLSAAIAKDKKQTGQISGLMSLKLNNPEFFVPYNICTTIQKVAGAFIAAMVIKAFGRSEREQYLGLILNLGISFYQTIKKYKGAPNQWDKNMTIEAEANKYSRIVMVAQLGLLAYLSRKAS